MKTVSLAELQSKLQGNSHPILIEALPERYYRQGHLPHAVQINVGEAKAKAPQILPNKNAALVVYCASVTCTNSDQVAIELHMLGYSDVAVYKGGKAEWESAGNQLQ